MLSLECFQVHVGEITTLNRTYEWEDRRRGKGEAPCERSRAEHREGQKGGKGGPPGKWWIHQKGYRLDHVTRCGRDDWTFV